MKRHLQSFLSGALISALILATSTAVLATTGAITIEVNPIDVLIDGEVFQPKDGNGDDAMVFVYEGTTYAPLRALAEAYGLEVGYDAEQNLATVNRPKTVGLTVDNLETLDSTSDMSQQSTAHSEDEYVMTIVQDGYSIYSKLTNGNKTYYSASGIEILYLSDKDGIMDYDSETGGFIFYKRSKDGVKEIVYKISGSDDAIRECDGRVHMDLDFFLEVIWPLYQ